MSCSSTPAPTINIPGRSAVAAGVRQDRSKVIIDCLNRQAKWIALKGAPHGRKWKSIEGKQTTQPIADENCSRINSLQASSYMKWADGSANKDDKLAQEVLPGSTPQMIRNLERNIRNTKNKNKKSPPGINCNSPVYRNKPMCR